MFSVSYLQWNCLGLCGICKDSTGSWSWHRYQMLWSQHVPVVQLVQPKETMDWHRQCGFRRSRTRTFQHQLFGVLGFPVWSNWMLHANYFLHEHFLHGGFCPPGREMCLGLKQICAPTIRIRRDSILLCLLNTGEFKPSPK